MKKRFLFVLLILMAVAFSSCKSSSKKSADAKPPKKGKTAKNQPTTPPPAATPSTPTPYLTAAAEAKTFDLRDGYRLELVLSDPIIREPVLTVFDGNGRMYVAEMRTYMQDINGQNQLVPRSCVSVHWSSKHNGVYDKHAIYADNLILPRMILPLAEGVLINETGTEDIYLYQDTKGDGVADKKVMWRTGGGRGGNLEHQASGLIWDVDNWLYMTVNAYRLRLKGSNIVSEPTNPNLGQWGLCQDDNGKTFFSNAGYETGPVSFQVPIIYGSWHFQESTINDYHTVWPLVGLADFQGGTVRVRPENQTLNHFTATCGQEIYRGDRLPADLRGDLIFGEPVGRLVRRTKVDVKEGYTYLRNAYDKTEFIRSSDPNFRPVNVANAPDGTLYITDMYRGVIQESAWVNQGSYLRGIVEKNQLDKNFGRGRIWRLVHDGAKPGPQPHMLDEKPTDLVKHLEHPNGWWRDTAQKLLVLKGDKSVVPAVEKLARGSSSYLGRIHAIWTLEGLDALDPALLREKLKDENYQVRLAAIRASESLYKAGDHSLVPDLAALAKDPNADVVLQLALSANLIRWEGWGDLINAIVASNQAHGIQTMIRSLAPAAQVARNNPVTPGAPAPPPPPQFTVDEKRRLSQGEVIYKQLCFACHGLDGKGTPLAGAKPGTTMAPPLSGSRTAVGSPDAIISVVLKGLSGPVNGNTYDAQMVPMQSNDDDWIAAVTSYIRNNYDNHATFINSNDVARVRTALKDRVNPWTLEELMTSLPQPMTNRAQWKLTASHNPSALPQTIDGNPQSRYDTAHLQIPGMWVQVELPEALEVSGLILDATNSPNDYPRGYKVELSTDGQNWGQPVAGGDGTCPYTQIIFPTALAKFIRITQTAAHPSYYWSIHELQVLQPAHPHKIEVALAAPPQVEPPKPDQPLAEQTPTGLAPADPFNLSPLAPPETPPTASSTPTPPVVAPPAPVPVPAPAPTPAPPAVVAPATTPVVPAVVLPPPVVRPPPPLPPISPQAAATPPPIPERNFEVK